MHDTEKFDPIAFGKKVRCFRSTYKLPRDTMAFLAGSNYATIQWLEKGFAKRPRPETIERLEKLMEVFGTVQDEVEQHVRKLYGRADEVPQSVRWLQRTGGTQNV